MLLRREFLNSLASFAALAGPAAAMVNSSIKSSISAATEDLRWRSFVVETVPSNDAYRTPVVTRVSLQSIGDLIAIVGDDHVVSIYSHQKQAYEEHIKRHKDWVRGCTFSPDGQTLATAGNDRALYLWRVGQWDSPQQIKRHNEAIVEIAFSPDGNLLATVGFCAKLALYEIPSGRLVTDLTCPCRDMHAVAFSQDGTLLAAGGRCGTIRTWNVATQKQVSDFTLHRKRIRSVEFTPTNEIVSAGDDQYVRITDPNVLSKTRSLPRHASKLYATTVIENQLLATAGSDNLIHIWQLDSLNRLGSLRGHTGTVSTLTYSQGLLVSGSYDTQVRIWKSDQLGVEDQRTTDRGSGWNPALK
jgi:WD40 repeat protein